MAASTISMDQVKHLLNYTIDNNLRLSEKHITPIAISLESSPGIGKTSIVEQVAKERNMTYVKISLAQLEEAGDLIGFPMKEYECQILKRTLTGKDAKGNPQYKIEILPKTVWVNEKQLDAGPGSNMKFQQTGKSRMAYAKPTWVPEYNENGILVNLDDFSRANPQLLQATMDLILTQGYMTWKFPEKTTTVITTNPDDGNNNVNSLDEAQRTRMLNFDVSFSLDAWAKWAEDTGVDGRCINFVMSYADALFSADEDGNRICNPRSFVMFANMISGISDWDNTENLAFIKSIAKGCFKDEGGKSFAEMFTQFIRHKMHLLIQPKDMLLGSWDKVKSQLEACLYDQNGSPRPDIASLLERRFVNYVSSWLKSPDKTPIEKVEKRLIDFLDNEENGGKALFTQDLYYHMIKTITSDNRRQTNKLMFNPKIANIIN